MRLIWFPKKIVTISFIAMGLLLFGNPKSATLAADKWYPLQVDVWQPPFNKDKIREDGTYIPLEKAEKAWKICASIPHLKDPYWTAVNFGLIDQAKEMGVGLRMFEAGGYGNLEIQRKQIQECMKSGADALIIGGISAEGLNDLIERYAGAGKVVVDLINGINSPHLTARSGVDFWDMGYLTARHLRDIEKDSQEQVNVAWFPGPEGANWVEQGDMGFRKGLEGSPIKILTAAKGDTGRATQGNLVNVALEAFEDIDDIVGTAVTANAAVDVIRRKGLAKKVKVLSYYYGPGIHRSIRRGTVIAAPTDLPALQARMSVDMTIRALEKKTFLKHVGPKVIVVDQKSVKSFDASTSLPPRGFRPIFSVNDW